MTKISVPLSAVTVTETFAGDRSELDIDLPFLPGHFDVSFLPAAQHNLVDATDGKVPLPYVAGPCRYCKGLERRSSSKLDRLSRRTWPQRYPDPIARGSNGKRDVVHLVVEELGLLPLFSLGCPFID